MIKNGKSLLYFIFIILLLVNFDLSTKGQEKVNLSIGAGLPELIYMGAHYQLNQMQIGLSAGSLPGNWKVVSILGDFRYHFGGSSGFSDKHPWYVRAGLNYWREESSKKINHFTYLTTRVGRELNISEKLGIALDIGLIYELSVKEIVKEPVYNSWSIGPSPSVLPGFGVGFFYRL